LSDVRFFWSQHYDVLIIYVGHAERWAASGIEEAWRIATAPFDTRWETECSQSQPLGAIGSAWKQSSTWRVRESRRLAAGARRRARRRRPRILRTLGGE
jgi:hypothetical protein